MENVEPEFIHGLGQWRAGRGSIVTEWMPTKEEARVAYYLMLYAEKEKAILQQIEEIAAMTLIPTIPADLFAAIDDMVQAVGDVLEAHCDGHLVADETATGLDAMVALSEAVDRLCDAFDKTLSDAAPPIPQNAPTSLRLN